MKILREGRYRWMEEISVQNIVIGSGAAGLAAALRLAQGGQAGTVIATENLNAGTSRNTGSDKQTYYKLSLAAGDPDSVRDMAEDLFDGQCVDGDQALCEAALSVRGFMSLVDLGVPFPCTEYGEYMGYKTDHDRGRRATSAGPYTSRMMTEALEAAVRQRQIPIYDHTRALKLLVKDNRVHGVLCLKQNASGASFVIFWGANIVLATGGPAAMYLDSVYPQSQLGSSGMAFEAGVPGKNLTEWQFGMASVQPRWNVSGTYMQVLPTFVSTRQDGSDEREFLSEFFDDPGEMLGKVFLKGYQWPFDVNKIFGGSSILDLLVYRETILRGRRVWLDFRVNAGGGELPVDKLPAEAHDYLAKAGALFGTPIERLAHMNAPAIAFYREHGVDLSRQRLEIALCAQHNNGGLLTDSNWQTPVEGLYAVGEVNGSHGVTRPGGTALNAGQVGALRAAQAICGAARRQGIPRLDENVKEELRRQAEDFARLPGQTCGTQTLAAVWRQAAKRMTACGGMIRDPVQIQKALQETEDLLDGYLQTVQRPAASQQAFFYRLRDCLVSQKVYLSAMLDYAQHGGGSRGSALYTDPKGRIPAAGLPECFRCTLDEGRNGHLVQEIVLGDGDCTTRWRQVRPLPEQDYFFENQWRAYRDRNGI